VADPCPAPFPIADTHRKGRFNSRLTRHRSIVRGGGTVETDRSIISANGESFGLADPVGIAGLRDPVPNLTGPGPERYHAKQAVARILTIQPAFRAARDDELCLSTCEKQTVTSSG
jgi:hypothetical protein